mmetsp:Transcript_88/g.218  ORF Transcript_88/g.218 Transcript_88/m.218 type:complete len:225 (+) Transcript_88:1459-2133(+)
MWSLGEFGAEGAERRERVGHTLEDAHIVPRRRKVDCRADRCCAHVLGFSRDIRMLVERADGGEGAGNRVEHTNVIYREGREKYLRANRCRVAVLSKVFKGGQSVSNDLGAYADLAEGVRFSIHHADIIPRVRREVDLAAHRCRPGIFAKGLGIVVDRCRGLGVNLTEVARLGVEYAHGVCELRCEVDFGAHQSATGPFPVYVFIAGHPSADFAQIAGARRGLGR